MTRRRITLGLFWVLIVALVLVPVRVAQVMARTGWSPDPSTVVFLTAVSGVIGLWLNRLARADA